MKFTYDIENGKIYFEKEPMSADRFEAVCWIVGIGIVLFFVYSLFSLVAR